MKTDYKTIEGRLNYLLDSLDEYDHIKLFGHVIYEEKEVLALLDQYIRATTKKQGEV